MTPRYHHRHPGFTLVELLTVVGIIALLISILMPALARAREQAKKVSTAAQLSAIEKGLEMFHNDFGQYPNSAVRQDPITDWPDGDPADNAILSGAHWLARAMAGHDGVGVDAGGLSMKWDPLDPVLTWRSLDLYPTDGNPPGVNSTRRGPYAEGKMFALDTRPTGSANFRVMDNNESPPEIGPQTGRRIIFDVGFGFPVLYYRATPRSMTPMSATTGGVYNQSDNAALTDWDFALTGSAHGIGYFGDLSAIHDPPPAGYRGKTFVDYLHDHNAGQSGGVGSRPMKPNSFLLIAPGPDGIYGTPDDSNNFQGAL